MAQNGPGRNPLCPCFTRPATCRSMGSVSGDMRRNACKDRRLAGPVGNYERRIYQCGEIEKKYPTNLIGIIYKLLPESGRAFVLALEKTGNPASASKGCWRMRNAKLGGRSTYGALTAVSDRRTRRAERQFLVNNIAVAGAFLFVGAVVFGLVG